MEKIKILTLLANLQKDCSEIELSIGSVKENGCIDNQVLIIRKCPPRVLKELVSICSYHISVDHRGVVIYCKD